MNTTNMKLEYAAVKEGITSIFPLALFIIAFGAAFGLAAFDQGLSQYTTVLMSVLVFAGAAQFGVLDLWGAQVPILPLVITVFAINARHLLIGATLYPHIKHLSPARRYSVMLVASDANWALSMREFNAREASTQGVGLLFGGGLAIWLFWGIGTWLGFYFAQAIHNPADFGLDLVMACFLLTMVLEGNKESNVMVIWGAAAMASLLAYRFLPENSHVIVGTLVGGVMGVILGDRNDEH